MALTGTGTIDMTVTPVSYGFGSVKDGSKAVKAIVVHNYQTNSVSLSESFSGPNAGDFSVTGGTCTSTMAANVCLFTDRDLRSERDWHRIGDYDGHRQPRSARSVHGFIHCIGNDS